MQSIGTQEILHVHFWVLQLLTGDLDRATVAVFPCIYQFSNVMVAIWWQAVARIDGGVNPFQQENKHTYFPKCQAVPLHKTALFSRWTYFLSFSFFFLVKEEYVLSNNSSINHGSCDHPVSLMGCPWPSFGFCQPLSIAAPLGNVSFSLLFALFLIFMASFFHHLFNWVSAKKAFGCGDVCQSRSLVSAGQRLA